MNEKKMLTYCNPLAIPDLPWGKDDWFRIEPKMFSHENKPASVTVPDYRSISDPTVFYHDSKWYLYPSYGMTWVSEDFAHWKHIRTEPYCPKYAPSICKLKNGFLLSSSGTPLYFSDSPEGPFTELGPLVLPDGKTFNPSDPAVFADDDGRLYIYYHKMRKTDNPHFPKTRILGAELDPDNPCKIIRGPVLLAENESELRPCERGGNSGQNTHFCWLEGPHMIKHNGRYYLITAAPNTEYESYCMEVFYSDKDPLDEHFIYQKRNPLTNHRTGVVRGGAHGSVEHGPGNTLWAFYTLAVGYAHMYERRIGMDRVEIDENGEMYCPYGVTDTPRIAPGQPNAGTDIGYLPLNEWTRPTASSALPGRDALYSCDGSVFSFWQPTDDDKAPTITYNLKYPYTVGAVRLMWRDIGLDYLNGKRPGAFRYILEGKIVDTEYEWVTLIDRSSSDEDFNVDYRTFEEKDNICAVRLRIVGLPEGIRPGLIDCTIFGYMQ